MYGYANQPMTGSIHPGSRPLRSLHRTSGTSLFGADPPAAAAAPSALQTFMDKEYAGVKTKYILGGLAVAGLGYYGYTKGWF